MLEKKDLSLYNLLILFFCISLLCVQVLPFTSAATISGNVYDDSLDSLNNVVIKVNSAPPQQHISKDGAYIFELTSGNYTIHADYFDNKILKYSANENISITKKGNYKLDLILFSVFDDDLSLGIDDDLSLGIINENDDYSFIRILILIFAILLFIAVSYALYRYKRILKKDNKIDTKVAAIDCSDCNENADTKEIILADTKDNIKKDAEHQDKEQQQLMKLLKEHKRITQKEIRQEIPLSEAKISLMITELEHKGVVEKIKKGRGNIIILK